MKHHRLVTKTPQVATTNLQAKLNFLQSTYSNLVQIYFGKHGGTAN